MAISYSVIARFGLFLQSRTSVVKVHFRQGIVNLGFLVASGLEACLKFAICSSKIVLEEFVLNSLKASPLTKPFSTPSG